MGPRFTRRRALAVAGSALLAGCSVGPLGSPTPTPTATGTPTPIPTPERSFEPDDDWEAPTTAPTADVRATTLVENMEVPWDVSVAPNGDLFVTERVGRVNTFTAGELESVLSPDDAIDAGAVDTTITERPWWVKGGEGGTLGVAVHPGYPDVSYLFLYYTAKTGDGKTNRISRFDVAAEDPAATEEILVGGIPASKIHNGGRLTFGPRGYLWATTGEAGEGALSADTGSRAGKVLRMTVNGEPAPDNPVLGDDADPLVVTYGHRNPQGIVWLPDGTTVLNEHGPTGFDEVNHVVPGDDYGWPRVRRPDGYRENADVHPPLATSGGAESWAPTGSCFYTGDAVPSWRNRMVIGGLVSQQVIAMTLTPPGAEPPPTGEHGERFDADWFDDAYTATAHYLLGDEFGRVRHVEQGLDGECYLITSNRDGRAKQPFPKAGDDRLLRLEAA